MNAQEAIDRANARVCDGVVPALPHALTPEQRVNLLRGWCDDVSRGAAYVAALHHPSPDGDARNHHAHVVLRDRDPATGRRMMKSTDREFATRVREGWELHVNAAMAAAGLPGRTDRRSHAARGLASLPQLHVRPYVAAATGEIGLVLGG